VHVSAGVCNAAAIRSSGRLPDALGRARGRRKARLVAAWRTSTACTRSSAYRARCPRGSARRPGRRRRRSISPIPARSRPRKLEQVQRSSSRGRDDGSGCAALPERATSLAQDARQTAKTVRAMPLLLRFHYLHLREGFPPEGPNARPGCRGHPAWSGAGKTSFATRFRRSDASPPSAPSPGPLPPRRRASGCPLRVRLEAHQVDLGDCRVASLAACSSLPTRGPHPFLEAVRRRRSSRVKK